jgi:hypothetical protein
MKWFVVMAFEPAILYALAGTFRASPKRRVKLRSGVSSSEMTDARVVKNEQSPENFIRVGGEVE